MNNLRKILTAGLLVLTLAMSSITASAAAPSWTKAPSMPDGKDQMLTATADGKIYVLGGIGAAGQLVSVQAYDPSTKIWTKKADMPTLRSGATVAVSNGNLYVIGGSVDYQASDLVEMYNPKTDTWTTLATMPTKRTGLKSVVMDGKIYAIGGRDIYSGQSSQVDVYDVATNRWSSLKSLSGAIDGTLLTSTTTNIFAVDLQVWVAGNMNAHVVSKYDLTSDAWHPLVKQVYNPAQDKFHTEGIIAPDFIPGRGTSYASSNGAVYYLNSQNDIVRYDAKANRFSKVAKSPFNAMGASMAIAEGRLYVMGGFSFDERKSLDTVMSLPIGE